MSCTIWTAFGFTINKWNWWRYCDITPSILLISIIISRINTFYRTHTPTHTHTHKDKLQAMTISEGQILAPSKMRGLLFSPMLHWSYVSKVLHIGTIGFTAMGITEYGSIHGSAAVLLPGFASKFGCVDLDDIMAWKRLCRKLNKNMELMKFWLAYLVYKHSVNILFNGIDWILVQICGRGI